MACASQSSPISGAYLSPFGCFVPTRSTDLVSGIYSIAGHPRQRQGRVHQHGAGLRLSRRRTARGRLSSRAPRRRRGARTRAEPRRHPPRQFRAALGDALHVGDQARVRFRRVREGDGPLHGGGGVVVVPGAARAQRAQRHAARHRHGDLHRTLRRRLSRDRVDRVQGRRPRRTGDGQSGIRHRPHHRVQAAGIGPARRRCRPHRRDHGRHRPHAGGADRRLARALPSAARRFTRPGARSSRRAPSSPRILLEASAQDVVFDDGAFGVPGTDLRVDLFQVAKAARDPAKLPAGMEPGLDATHHRVPPAQTFPNGCHIVEVEIDPGTGAGQHRTLHDRRRLRPHHQSAAARRTGAWRDRAGHRAGAARACGLRFRRRPAPGGLVHGLRHAARRRPSVLRFLDAQRALDLPIRSASRAPARPAPSARRRR